VNLKLLTVFFATLFLVLRYTGDASNALVWLRQHSRPTFESLNEEFI
jgi:hypothetical protein